MGCAALVLDSSWRVLPSRSIGVHHRYLGIHNSNLRRWVRQYKSDAEGAFSGKGHLSPDHEAMRQLQRENARLY